MLPHPAGRGDRAFVVVEQAGAELAQIGQPTRDGMGDGDAREAESPFAGLGSGENVRDAELAAPDEHRSGVERRLVPLPDVAGEHLRPSSRHRIHDRRLGGWCDRQGISAHTPPNLSGESAVLAVTCGQPAEGVTR